ncbi:MAG TPA: ABC transporter substrate-binding protein [Ktedonobacteraceae bacterium]|nr:ABC transporter substrate-binding protein [Ktedonobacteraceae bacterium]
MHRPLSRSLSGLLSRRRTFSTYTAMIFLVCLFLLSACGGGNASPNTTSNQPKKGGNLSVGLIAEPTVLDPLTSVTLYDTDIMANIYDTLFTYDLHNTIQPELVSSYSYPSPTVLSLTLRSGVTFQDGTPFNAEAVIFNLNRFLNDKTSPRYTDVVNIASVKQVSDLQVQILLKQPFAPLLNVLTGSVGMMLSPTAVQKLGKKLGQAPTGVGSGPFMFVEWIKGDHLLLKANPNYWQKDAQGNRLPYLQTIRYRTITNGTVMYTNLETAQIQVASTIDPNEVAVAKSNASLIYKQVAGPGFGSIFMNNAAAPVNNVHVRRAIAWGINRQEIVDHVFHGVGVVAKGPVSPVSWAYNKNIVSYAYDPAKAKAELAQSGQTNVSLTLLIQSSNPTSLQEAQFIQSELQPVGITVTIKPEIFTTEVTDVQTFNYQAALLGWTGSLDPDGSTYPLFTSTGGFNYTKYANSQVDTFLNAARTATNQAQRVPDYQQAEQLIVQDSPYIFINHPAVYQATTNSVKNYALLPSGVLDFTSVYLSS